MSTYHHTLTADIIATAAIAGIRSQIGRSRVAAEWSRLTLQQRAMLCYGAKLRPGTYAHMELEEMTTDEREAIRQALVEMKRGLRDFVALDRTEWRHAGNQTPQHRHNQQEQERAEQQSRMKLAQQARQLNNKLNALNAKSPGSGN